MKYFIYIGMLFLVASGCKPGVPASLIQPDKMGEILYDIHIVDSYINTITNTDSAKKVAAAYYKGIYKKFDVDSAQYTKSLDYYSQDPKAFSDIYKKVTNDLNQQKITLVKADSIVNAKIAKKARLKFTADSTKRADSIAKTPAFKKARLKFKADSIKRADSIAKTPAFKAMLKKKADSKAKTDSIMKVIIADRQKILDSVKRTTPFRWPVNLKK